MLRYVKLYYAPTISVLYHALTRFCINRDNRGKIYDRQKRKLTILTIIMIPLGSLRIATIRPHDPTLLSIVENVDNKCERSNSK